MPEILLVDDDGPPIEVELCVEHETEVRELLIQYGHADVLELTDGERMARMVAGETDAYSLSIHRLFACALTLFGNIGMRQASGCSVCAFQCVATTIVEQVAREIRRPN